MGIGTSLMRRFLTPVLIFGCLFTLTFACFGKAIFLGEQFAYRDAAHFYYPLYERVQAEWQAGRWPLWEPEENAGMPLLGNPTAAVLYPGKLILAAVPYPLGARLYVIAHTLLAFAAALALLRSWGTSWVGSALAALAYAFGAPILFQYCNIIYLVGAAWAPLGLRAVDGWLRLGRRFALVELAVVLALETLGGDPEIAYLTGICAAGYAVLLACRRARSEQNPPRKFNWLLIPGALALIAFWIAATLTLAHYAPVLRPIVAKGQPSPRLPGSSLVSPIVAVCWGAIGLLLLSRWRRAREGGRRPVLVPMLSGLAASALLGGALSAAQLLPVFEFTALTSRASSEGPHDIYPFSLEPLRLVEFLWPNVFGTPFHGNRFWQPALPPVGDNVKVWVPSLYLGCFTLVLALTALRFRGGSPWLSWLSAIALISIIGSLGEYTSPLWIARLNLNNASWLGPPDPLDVAALRFDRYLRDGDGSLYGIAATLLPGFRQFRFPSKLLTFTALALAALAGQGWDLLARDEPRARRKALTYGSAFLFLTLSVLIATIPGRASMLAWLTSLPPGSSFGPLDAPGAFRETQFGLLQTAIVLALALILIVFQRMNRGSKLAAILGLSLITADLAIANARYILTVPQALFDSTPSVISFIQDYEQEHPSTGPFRVHRMPIWNPVEWQEDASDDRVADFVRWERETIQPKYGITPYGIQYTMTIGVAELYDYEWFFGGFRREIGGQVAQSLGVGPGERIVVFPRRSFDMWNTRYFVLPYFSNGWKDEHRGFASFLEDTTRLVPPLDAFDGPDGKAKEMEWVKTHDYQIRLNRSAYPRAWVVHAGRFMRPIQGLNRADRDIPMQEILFSNDPLWSDPTRTVYHPRSLAWLEQDARAALGSFLAGGEPSPNETVNVNHQQSDRVELEAVLDRPGLVVLADVYYPGWTLTIDGAPAPVYRVNRMMRGAAVSSGRHKLIYSYQPNSFRYGLIITCSALVSLFLLALVFFRRPIDSLMTENITT